MAADKDIYENNIAHHLRDSKTDKAYKHRHFILILLTLIYAFNFIDRQIIGIVSPFIQADLGLTNTQLGLLKGLLFAALYSIIGIPIAWLADRYSRINIISMSLAIWSGFTALTGLATNFITIGAARMGVGIGEAGGSPPSHSLISDLYPKEERASALAIYSIGIPLGLGFAYFLTGLLLGDPQNAMSWRSLLIILGISGIMLAIIARLIIPEPQRGAQDNLSEKAAKVLAKAPFIHSVKTLFAIKSWWAMCMGIALASFTTYAVSTWQVDYLLPFDATQDQPQGFRKMMYILAALNFFIYGSGTFFGGWITQKLARKSIRAYGFVPALSMFICLPLLILTFWSPSSEMHLLFGGLLLFFVGIYLGPSFAIAQTLAPVNMRAMSTALYFLILNMIALGGGPTVAGILVDIFEPAHGKVHAIRLSLSWVSLGFVFSAVSFFIVTLTLPHDWAQAQSQVKAHHKDG